LKRLLLLGSTLLVGACQQQLANQSALAPQTRGHAFAKASCAACHGIERGSVLSPNPQAPSFPAIVNQQGLTAETLSSWLRNAHNYPTEMEFELDSRRVDDLVEYMLTLTDPNYRPIG
jgi:mono/diheme cytochrome c family protein